MEVTTVLGSEFGGLTGSDGVTVLIPGFLGLTQTYQAPDNPETRQRAMCANHEFSALIGTDHLMRLVTPWLQAAGLDEAGFGQLFRVMALGQRSNTLLAKPGSEHADSMALKADQAMGNRICFTLDNEMPVPPSIKRRWWRFLRRCK